MWREAPSKSHYDSKDTTESARSQAPGVTGTIRGAPEFETHPTRRSGPRLDDFSSRRLPAIGAGFESVERGGNSTPYQRSTTQYPQAFSSTARPKNDPRASYGGSSGSLPTPSTPSQATLPDRYHPRTQQSHHSGYPSVPESTGADPRFSSLQPGAGSGGSAFGRGATSSPFASREDSRPALSSESRGMPGLPPPQGSQLPRPDVLASRHAAPSSAPGATQYMTVETGHGQMSIPIDVQGASRIADEKRRRNAGASARFRARRKEKEMASSKEIEDLKQRVNDLSEDCDFYRQERDVLAAALYNSAEGSRLFPRPASPRRRRSLYDNTSRSEDSQEPPNLQRYEERGQHGGYGSVSRRRLDTPPPGPYSFSAPALSQSSYPRQAPTLPPLQPSQSHPQSQLHHTQLPAMRSVSHPGYPAESYPPSPRQSGYPSQAHSRSQSSTRSQQSATSQH